MKMVLRKSNNYRDKLEIYEGKSTELTGYVSGFRVSWKRGMAAYCIKKVYCNGKFVTGHIWLPVTDVVREFTENQFHGMIPDKTKVKINCYIDEYNKVEKQDGKRVCNLGIKFVDSLTALA